MNQKWRGRSVAVALFIVFGAGAGCSKMTVATDLNGKMQLDTRLEGSMRIEGPIVMQMRGPTVKYQGVYVSDACLERVRPDETHIDWVVAVFGEPTDKARLGDGTEIWKWAYVPLEQEASVVSLFGGSKDEPRLLPSTTYLRIRGGVVIEKWRD